MDQGRETTSTLILNKMNDLILDLAFKEHPPCRGDWRGLAYIEVYGYDHKVVPPQ